MHGAKCITLYFETLALVYDDLDFVTVSHDDYVKKKVTGFGKNTKVKVTGNEATIRFVTYGGRSPNPSSAGFIMHYEAGNAFSDFMGRYTNFDIIFLIKAGQLLVS